MPILAPRKFRGVQPSAARLLPRHRREAAATKGNALVRPWDMISALWPTYG